MNSSRKCISNKFLFANIIGFFQTSGHIWIFIIWYKTSKKGSSIFFNIKRFFIIFCIVYLGVLGHRVDIHALFMVRKLKSHLRLEPVNM